MATKKNKPTPAENREAYFARWKLVNDLLLEEERNRTPEERLRRFFALMAQAKAMGWQTHTQAEIDAVRQRWIKIKDICAKKK